MLECTLYHMDTGLSIPSSLQTRGLHFSVGIRKADKPCPPNFTKKPVLGLEGSWVKHQLLHDLAFFIFPPLPKVNNKIFTDVPKQHGWLEIPSLTVEQLAKEMEVTSIWMAKDWPLPSEI